MSVDTHKARNNSIKTLFTATKTKLWDFVVLHRIATLIAAVVIIGTGTLVYAQQFGSEVSVEIRTVKIIPANVSGEGWRNLGAIGFQNLDTFALTQEFTRFNSAYPDPDYEPTAESGNPSTDRTESPVTGTNSPASAAEVEPTQSTSTTEQSSDTDTADVADADGGAESIESESSALTPEESPTAPSPTVDSAPATESDGADSPAELSEPEPASVAESEPEQEPESAPEPEPEPEPASEPEPTTSAADQARGPIGAMFARVTQLFPFVQATLSSDGEEPAPAAPVPDATGDTSATSEPEPTPSASDDAEPANAPLQSQAKTEPVAPVTTESIASTSQSDEGETPVEVTGSSTPVDAEPTSPAGTSIPSTSEQVLVDPVATPLESLAPKASSQSAGVSECNGTCVPYTIELSGFGLPIFDKRSELFGTQLRLSLAAERKLRRDEIQSVDIQYSLDNGQTWLDNGQIILDGEMSNSINGGYFLFAMPSVTTEAELNALSVRIVYQDDLSALNSLFVEAVWLEVFVVDASAGDEIMQSELLVDNEYVNEQLSGDTLTLPSGETVRFNNTDENEGETLIIKSDKRDYVGLTKTVTYFNVTNTSNRADEFSLQTYFPERNGSVVELKEYELNKPQTVVVPEYRPHVYHCEAGWEYSGAAPTNDLRDLSKLLSQPVAEDPLVTPLPEPSAPEVASPETEAMSPEVTLSVPTSSVADVLPSSMADTASPTTEIATGSAVTTPRTTANQLQESTPTTEAVTPTTTVEASPATSSPVVEIPVLPTDTASSTALRAPIALPFAQASVAVDSQAATSTTTEETEVAEEANELTNTFACRNTNIIRVCDSIDGGNTACRVDQVKVRDHEFTKYKRGWEVTSLNEGELPPPSVFRRVKEVIGLATDRKAVPDTFRASHYTDQVFEIAPGETKYFQMEIAFSPFSSGEYWVEAVGDNTYGLLDPFWSSSWRYRKEITIDNTGNASSTEQQVYIELDSSDSGFWTNVQSDGDDIRFIQEEVVTTDWYDVDWTKRIPLTIQSSQIDDDLNDHVVYVNLADLGSEFFADVQSDGDDIRITNVDSSTEFAYELVTLNTGAQSGELYFRASTTISSTTNTTFLLYFDNPTASGYSTSSQFGSEAVWANGYEAVYHLEEDASGTGNTGLYQDATANGRDADDNVASTGKTGKLGAGQEIRARESLGDDHIIFPSANVNSFNEQTFSFWVQTTQSGNQALVNGGASNEYLLFLIGSGNTLQLFDGGSSQSEGLDVDVSPASATWRHVTVSRDSNNNEWRIFIDGVEDADGAVAETMSALSIPSDCLVIGLEQDGSCLSSGDSSQHLDALIDEVRFQSVIPAAAEVAATFRNQSTSTDFYATSTVEEYQPVSFIELDFWVQHFDYSSQVADIWVQTESLPNNATSSIYLYYGNSAAESASDAYAPFTYSTTTDLYYIVNDQDNSTLDIYSYIDSNDIYVDGVFLGTIDSGESTSTATYASTSVISALGPITARSTADGAEAPVPISFASTTHAVASTRGGEEYDVYAPFADVALDIYEGANGAPDTSDTVLQGTSDTYSQAYGSAGILEGDEPFLLFATNDGTDDSIVAYPPTTRDLFGVNSQDYFLTPIVGGTDVTVLCSDGASSTLSSIARGAQSGNSVCTSSGGSGTGAGVRLASSTGPITAIQQRDGNGGESSVFLPEPEFATRYITPQDPSYISVVCSPRFGDATIEIQTQTGTPVAGPTTCSTSGELPDALNFNGTYGPGYQVVATNDVPFYVYYENGGDETNTWGAVQGRKFGSLDTLPLTVGAEEENTDAQYEQLNYRWYENNNAITPTTAWPSEIGTVAEGEAITGQQAIDTTDNLRLRMNLAANNGTGTVASTAFTLQYAQAETCSAVNESMWYDVGEIGSTTAAFTGYNNGSVTDGATLPSTVLSDSDVAASYEEENNSAFLPNEVGNGEAVEFDWVITPRAGVVESNAEYCFRMIRSTNVPLYSYTLYPQLLTAGPPEQATQFKRFDNEHASSTSPTLEFVAVDVGGDDLNYQVQLGTDNTFASTLIDATSGASFDFTNIQNPGDKAPFNNGQRIRYTVPSALSNGTTYYWRIRAIDPAGSNTYGDWSTTFSFTIDTSVTVSEWFQTTDEQFQTNSLTSATTTGDAVELDLVGGNVIGEFGSLTIDTGVTTTVSLDNTYTNPVVVTSERYPRSIADGDQPITRVFNKTATSFDVLAYTFDFSAVGSTTVDYVVMEAGDWLMDDGDEGVRVFATSTSVSAIDGANIATDPGGLDITFPTSFSTTPVVLAAITTSNDNAWLAPTVYDGNDISNPPTASQISLYLNDSLASDGHGSAEDMDIIAFDPAAGTNDGVNFATQNTTVEVGNAPIAQTFDTTYSSAPGVIVVQQQTMNGAQGGYAMVDTDTAPTASQVTVAFDEGGTAGGRGHADESISIVSFATATGTLIRAGNAQVVSTAIDFDDADVGNAWGTVNWTSSGDVTIRVQYQTGSGFQNIPDSALTGNSTGFTSGPVNILSLDTTIYNELRLVASLTGVNPQLSDWTVSWGQRVEIPDLGDPFDNEKTADTTPTFDFVSSDPQGDDLVYEISYSTDPTFATGSTTINSSSTPANFANLTTPADTSPFNSGDTITYTVPGGSELTNNQTFWWRVRAIDPAGNNAWSPWSAADNFTVATSTIVSSWFQTTQAQFDEGVLDGTVASTSDSVILSEDIGEYGSTTVSGNTWQTISTNLSYNNMVVVASPRYAFNGTDNGRTVQVRNKTSNSFEIKAENYTESLAGTTSVNYIVMEAGDWVIEDGGTGLRVVAGTAADVSVVNGSNIGYSAGTEVTPSPAFSSTPAALATVASANGAKWVSARVDDGTEAGEAAASSIYVSLGSSLDSDTSRDAEDIDYVLFETATGTNSTVLFDAFNTGQVVTEGETESNVSFNQSFSTAPGTIVVQNNGMEGGDGGSALVDTDGVTTNTRVYLSIAEHGASAGNHTTEVVSVFAFESGGNTIRRVGASGGALQGTIASEEVLFSDGLGPKFERALFSATTPGNSTTSLQVQYQTATGSWALIPDAQVPGNSTGNASSPVNLTGINVQTYPVIRLLATLTCDGADCPTLDDWTVEWSEGVALTGNLKAFDRTTNVANATITAYVNGVDTNSEGVTDANGDFSLSSITAFNGQTVTVFVDDAAEADEAVATFVYDGLGDMTNVQLFEQHLTLTSDETPTTTLTTLAQSDFSTIGDEDVFFDVDGSGNLDLCAQGTCSNASLWVSGTSTFLIATSTTPTVTVHDFVNLGDVRFGGSTLEVSGSWDNQSTLSIDTSTVIFTATSTTETLDDTDNLLEFNNLTFGQTSGTATWQPLDTLDVAGDLSVTYGTLNRNTELITVAGALSTGANGFWSGLATTTFDGGGNHTWSDANAISQDIGYAVIDGAARTVTVASDVQARSLTIGANDTLNGGGANDIKVAGNFTNNNVFVPATSRLVVVGTSTNSIITTGASSLYTFRASTTGAGTVSFTESSVTLLDNFEIATGTVTLPTTLLTVGGSFSNTGGVFVHNNSAVEFTSGGTETVQQNGDAFLNAFYDVTFSGAGSWDYLDTNATTSNTWTHTNGLVTFPAGQLSIERDFTTSGSAAFDANGGEVLFWVRSLDTITTNGSPFNDVRVRKGDPVRGGAFDSSWLYRDMITIEASQIDEDLTDFPVYLDLSDFDSNFFSNLNSDGGDIRITESDGVTEVPREVVFASTTAETGEVYFKAPSLSSTTNSTFYVYYGNSGASDYAVTATSGAQNVWDDDFLAVYHMQQDPPLDSTSYNRDTAFVGDTPAVESSVFGNAVRLTDNAGNDYVDLQSDLDELDNAGEMTVSGWVNFTADNEDEALFVRELNVNTDPVLLWKNDVGNEANDTYTFNAGTTGDQGNRVDAEPTGVQNAGEWQYVAGSMNGANRYVYVNDGTRETDTTGDTTLAVNTNGAAIGYWGVGTNDWDADGLFDEFRISQVERSESWLNAEFRNMSTSTDFYTVTSGAGSSTRVFSDGTVTATGDVVIEGDATAQLPTTNFIIQGSFDNDGTFIPGTGSVTFTATTGVHTVEPGNSSFYTLGINNTGGAVTINEHATATNAVALSPGGGLFALASNQVLESQGTFTNSMNNASTTWNSGSVLRLTSGTDFAINAKTDSGDDYNELELTADTDISMWNSTATTYDTQASSSIYSQDHATTDGDLYIFGDYRRATGTEYWSYGTDFDGADLAASSTERQANVRIADGGVVVVSAATLNIQGTSTATSTINNQGSGTYSVTVTGGTIDASYYYFESMSLPGLQLLASTTVTSLADGFFEMVNTNPVGITVSSTTLDANPALEIYRVGFNMLVPIMAFNVEQSDGTPSSYWWFRDSYGNMTGEANDIDTGNPGSIRWDDSAYNVNVSGVVYADDGATPLAGPTCDGSTNNVRIVVNEGAYTDAVPCSAADGSYSFTGVSYTGDPKVVVYLDTNGGSTGAVITKTLTGDVTDLDVYANRVMTRHESTAALTIADMFGTYDESDDSDLRFVVATGTPDTLVVRPETELIVASSTTFTPGGNITLESGGSGAVYDGSFHIDDNATFVAGNTEAHSIGGSFFADSGATFTGASSTYAFTATTSGKTITGSSSLTFNDITFTGDGGGWNINTDLTIMGDMTVSTGTVTGTSDVTLTNGSMTGNGLVSMGGGTVTIEETNTLGGTQGWTFNNLTLGSGTDVGTTTRASTATTTILSTLTIANAHFLDADSSLWNLNGTGNVFVESGTLLEDTSRFTYSGAGAANILPTTYYDLTLAGTAGTPSYLFPVTGLLIQNDFVVAGAVTTDANLASNDPVVQVNGDVRIGANGNLIASDITPLTVLGSWDNDGSFTSSNGEVVFASPDAYTVAAGPASFADVTLTGAGAATMTESATSTGTFTLASTSDFTLNPATTLAVGTAFFNQSAGAATDWTDSTLFLYGGNYTVNASTTSDVYGTVAIGSAAQVRTWNSSAATTTAQSGGGLYSQDHATTDGDLYLFGDVAVSSQTDHWSYATDFDGTTLTGLARRAVDVRVAPGGSVTYSGGSLSIVGTTTASTTIAAQSTGDYAFNVSGGTFTAEYYEFADLDSDGLTLTGTPDIPSLSYGLWTVDTTNDAALTVDGSVINENAGRNIINNQFATTSGVTSAVNVRFTGSAVSSWRYNAHSGDIDGEDFDDDGGDPGEIVWDNSTSSFSISGTVYQSDTTSPSAVCGGTANILIAINSVVTASTTCNGSGVFQFDDLNFDSNDTLTVFIDGEATQAVTVASEPVASIGNFDLYEAHVIVRHESSNPITIAQMATFDNNNDSDLLFTAVDAGTDTLTLESDVKLIVWDSKEFAPGGDITTGGGANDAFDGTVELQDDATLTFGSGESHSLGGDLVLSSSATFAAGTATTTFTSTGSGRSLDTNDAGFYTFVIGGSGTFTSIDTTLTIANDLVLSSGALTLPAATTTIAGSLVTTSGSFDANGGTMVFTSAGTETVSANGSNFNALQFTGTGSWSLADTNATATAAVTNASGTVTLPSGTLALGADFINTGTLAANNGTVRFTSATGTDVLTLGGSDLHTIVRAGGGTTTMTDGSAQLLGDVTVANGTLITASNTLSIAGSLDATGGTLVVGSSTLLFNSADTGETVAPGNNLLYNMVFGNASGGWTLMAATTTRNFSLLNAADFTLQSGATLYVGNVFANNVGGSATTWDGTTVILDGGIDYSINTASAGGDDYDVLDIRSTSNIRAWESQATTTLVASDSSLYSQDHAGTDGSLWIYGAFTISTTTEYWSYATDFNGVALGGAGRAVTVTHATGATTTVSQTGTLNVVGSGSGTTTIQSSGSHNYDFSVSGGTITFNRYAFRDVNNAGLELSGTPTISDLSYGDYEIDINGASAITLATSTLNANPALLITDTRFATSGSATNATNVNLAATTTNAWTFRDHFGGADGEAYDQDGVTDCGSIRWDDSECLQTEQTDYRWRNDDGALGVPSSEWFDSDWDARKRVRFVNNDNQTYTNTAYEITVTYESSMQPDFDDLRFTADDGTTPIDFWIESVTPSTEAVVWVEVPSLPAESTATTFMYYDNGAATSTSSSTAPFVASDDFEDNNITEYSGQTSDFTNGTTYVYGGTYSLETAISGFSDGGMARFDQTVSQGESLRYRQYITTPASNSDEVCTMFGVQSPVSNHENYAVCIELFGTERVSLVEDVERNDSFGGVTVLASSTADFTTAGAGWYEVTVDWRTNDVIDVTVYGPNGAVVATTSATDATYTSGGYGFTFWDNGGAWDSFISRSLVETEPTVLFGVEQTEGGASWAAPVNTAADDFEIGDSARLRIALENTGLDITGQLIALEYASKGTAPACAAVAPGAFSAVPVVSSCGSSPICMATSSSVTNGASTVDLLPVGSNTFTAGQFREDPSNQTTAIDIDQNFYTEVEYAIEITSNATDQSYCFRVTDNGTAYDAYEQLPELTLRFDPVIGTITFNGGTDIILLPGTTTRVFATSSVTDLNGFTDLTAGVATSTMYTNVAGALCTADENDCYIETLGAQCSYQSCSGTSCVLSCYADFIFHADPTDATGGDWFALFEVEDGAGGYAFNTSLPIDVGTMRALEVTDSIAYPALEPLDNSGTTNPTSTITNVGNEGIDVLVSGSDLTDGGSSNIPVSQQRLATTSFDYSSCTSGCIDLGSTATTVEVDLAKPTVVVPPVRDDIYWGIEVPFGVSSNQHSGSTTFMATAD